MILVVLMLVLGGCASTSIVDDEVRENGYYQLLAQVRQLEDEHYFSVLGPMARQYFYDDQFGSGVYAYTNGKLVKLGRLSDSEDPGVVIVTIAGHMQHNWTYCVYRSYYWQKAPDHQLTLVSRGIIEEGRAEGSRCNPADRFHDRKWEEVPEVRILP